MPTKPVNKMAEAAFLLGTLLIALGTTLMSKAGFGMSMVVAPAYVLSDLFLTITPGTMCYLYYGVLVLLAMLLRRGFRVTFLFSFFASMLFGFAVDGFTWCFGFITAPSLPVRVLLYVLGLPVSSLSIALLLHSYFPPQPPELFVKEVAALLRRDVYKVKYAYDIASLLLAATLSLLFFRQLRYVGIGTFVTAVFNGPLIGFFGRKMDKIIDFSPLFPAVGKFFTEKKKSEV